MLGIEAVSNLDVRHEVNDADSAAAVAAAPAVRHCVHRSRSRFQVSTAAPTGNSQIAPPVNSGCTRWWGRGAGQAGPARRPGRGNVDG